jgi:hypothetical protein
MGRDHKGARRGKVSERTVIAPIAEGGMEQLRVVLQLRNGDLELADLVGAIQDMRFVFVDDDTKLVYAAFDGD